MMIATWLGRQLTSTKDTACRLSWGRIPIKDGPPLRPLGCARAGSRLRRMAMARRLAFAGLVLLMVSLGCGKPKSGPQKRADTKSKPVNLILVSVDTLRADHLPIYGYDRDTSPNLSALAKSSIVFEQAYAATTNTTPSHASMLTGLYPWSHGLRRDGWRLDENVTTLPELFQRAGYETGAFVSAVTMKRQTRLDRGFHVYEDRFEEHERRGDRTFEKMQAWLRRVAKKPFFGFLHMYDPHWKYDPPRSFIYRYLPSGFPLTDPHRDGVLGFHGTAKEREQYAPEFTARYDAEIAFADAQLGRLLTELDQLGVTNRTMIIFVSDHGETLFERQWVADHGTRVYDEQIRVPLVIHFPKGIHGGKRVTAQVHHVDLMPTLVEFFGIDDAPLLQGRSLMPLVESDGRWEEPRAVYSLARSDPRRVPHIEETLSTKRLLRSIRSPKEKLVEYPLERGGWHRELFQLTTDPGETIDTATTRVETGDRLHAQLEQWYKATGARKQTPPQQVPEEMREGLEALDHIE